MASERCKKSRAHGPHRWVETVHYRAGLRYKTKTLTHRCPGIVRFGG